MLAINIEDDTIRMVSFRGRRISFAAEAPLAEGWVQQGLVIDRLAVGQLIIRTLVENRVNERDVVACVSAAHSIYRVVPVPKLERRLLAEAARREMERASPVPIDTLYTAWQDVPQGAQIALCLLGLPRDNVDSVIDTMTLAGLKPRWLELRPLAVSRVIDEDRAVTVNIQQNGFDIAIIDAGIAELARSLTFPQPGMSDADKLGIIKEELDRTISFHNTGHAEMQLNAGTSCFLSGQLPEGLVENTGYAVRPLPSPVEYPAWVDARRFAANTGLILKEAGGKTLPMRVSINAIPQAVAPAKAAPKAGAAPLVALVVGAIIIIALFLASNSAARETADLQATVNAQTKLVTDMQTKVTQQSTQVVGQRDQLTQTLSSLRVPLDYVARQRTYSSRDLGAVTAALPAVMSLMSIHDDGGSIVLEGQSPSTELVLNYAGDLRQTGDFASVTVTAMNNLSYSEYAFSMTLGLKR